MKVKSIITCGLLLLGVGAATTSCEDMFTPENKLVSTDLAPRDTLYQVMGIIQKMQVLADRTVLLGEARADLVDVDPVHTPFDIQELNSNKVSDDNIYNQPADYYAVINNCNIYLAGVDSLLKAHGEYYYEKEICAVKSFRAWCYLELAKIYGAVPFVTEPVLSSDAAEDIVASGKKADMKEILDFLIQDLAKYPYMDENGSLRQVYGGKYNDISYQKFMIPVRPLLAELYLWRGSLTGSQQDYLDAVALYHDYFCFPGEELGISYTYSSLTASNVITYSYNSAFWYDKTFTRNNSTYENRFVMNDRNYVGFMPLDTVHYFGNVTDLSAVFNSQYSNDYYPAVIPSERMKSISKTQDYCKFINNAMATSEIVYGTHDRNDYKDPILEGDLRLSAVYYTTDNLKESQYNSNVNNMQSYIAKYCGGSNMKSTDKRLEGIPYFRTTILYLHMAEALNRAGFPETAHAILKWGLSYDILNDRSIISQDEFDRLCQIKTRGFSIKDAKYDDEMVAKTSNSFVIWPSDIFYTVDKFTGPNSFSGSNWWIQVGIHSLGSGDTEYNKFYYLDDSLTLAKILPAPEAPEYEEEPVLKIDATHEDSVNYETIVAANLALKEAYEQKVADVKAANEEYLASPAVRAKRQERVKQLILDEEALEGAFEGLRFYDIMRYQMQEGKLGSTITLPAYIQEKYGAMTKDNMTGKSWYLNLPKR